MVQNLIVFVIVVAAIAYAIWRFAPAAMTSALARRMAPALRIVGATHVAQKLETKPDGAACSDGCSSCDACGSARFIKKKPSNAAPVSIGR